MAFKNYDPLPSVPLTEDLPYLHCPDLPEVVHLEDPALEVIVDFKKHRPATVDAEELITNALLEMRVCDEHILLVKDKSDMLVGLISSADILGARTVRVIQDKKIPRAEVKVRHVMTPRDCILALRREDLRHAKVGHLVATLREHKQMYAVIIDQAEDGHEEVRGFISLSKMGKALGQDVAGALLETNSLAELQHLHS